MGTSGQAEDIVKYFYQNPLRIRGELVVFTLSAAFNFLLVSNEKCNFMFYVKPGLFDAADHQIWGSSSLNTTTTTYFPVWTHVFIAWIS